MTATLSVMETAARPLTAGLPVEYTPNQLHRIVAWLDEGIGKLRHWGIRVPDSGRLPAMCRILSSVSEQGEFPTDPAKLRVIAEAIQHAEEFVRITDVLPEVPMTSLVPDLQQAVGGLLGEEAPASRRHLQYQSQFWVAAMMVSAGAPTGVMLRPTGPNPDMVLSNGTLQYAVEVKRPEGELDARRVVQRACRQIRSGRFHGGAIVVDVTDCVDPSLVARVADEAPNMDQLRSAVFSLAGVLHREIFDEAANRIVTNREPVFSLTVFGRSRYWNSLDLARPHLARTVASMTYWRRDSMTLRGHRARWLSGLIHKGMEEVGFSLEQSGELDL